MASCKDCLHVEVCREYVMGLAAVRGVELNEAEIEQVLVSDDCDNFKDRSRFVELSCKVGERLYVPIPKSKYIAEYVVIAFWVEESGTIIRIVDTRFFHGERNYIVTTMKTYKKIIELEQKGKKIFEGDIVRYYHHKKSLVPVTDIKPEENHYGMDEESRLPLAYRTTKIIRYKGHVEIHPIGGMMINLKNRCEWWRNLNYEDDSINSDRLEVIGNIHDNPELLEVKE